MSDVTTASPILSMKYYLESTRTGFESKKVLSLNTVAPTHRIFLSQQSLGETSHYQILGKTVPKRYRWVIHMELASCLDMMYMRKLKYLAIALTLVEVILVTGLMYDVLVARESASAYSSSPAHEASPGDDSDSPSYGASPQATYSVDDSYLAERWGVDKINAPQAWQITRGDQAVVVAVLDTGISRDNQDLAGRVVDEVNFSDSPTSDDLYGHGTHMAGTIAAIAPECRLMNVKVADDTGKCEPSVVARGIVWAVDHGAKVINLSLAMVASRDLEQAVNYAWSRGAILVAAAGNKGTSDPSYPAYYDKCLAVAGTNENNSLALLSSYGDWVDVAAPGFNIYSELPENQYGYKTGTSAAGAHVSGVAALVFSIAEDADGDGKVNDEVRWAIENSCTPVGDDMGWGLINAYGAVIQTSPSSNSF
jgi:thermitase